MKVMLLVSSNQWSIFCTSHRTVTLGTADAFPVVASLPPKNSDAIFGAREETTGNASAVRRLGNEPFTRQIILSVDICLKKLSLIVAHL